MVKVEGELLVFMMELVAAGQVDMQVQVAMDQFLLILQDQAPVVVQVADVAAMAVKAPVQVAAELVYLVKVQVVPVELIPIKLVKVVQVVLMQPLVEETMEEGKPVVRVMLLQAEQFVLYGDSTVHSPQPTQVICKNNLYKKALRSLIFY